MEEPAPLAIRTGSSTAAEIYTAVGFALSWWEASEDIQMGVFKWLCGELEPIAFETYVASGRSARTRMLYAALARYEGRFIPEELTEIRGAMKALEKLASMRNQIAHGQVTHAQATQNGVVTMAGNFLVPSLNEFGVYVERQFLDFRYAHTAAEIDVWRDAVRAERSRIMDAHFAAMERVQDAENALSCEVQRTLGIAKAIAKDRLMAEHYVLSRAPSGKLS